MKIKKETTITLTCTNCGHDFEKTVAEYKRRLNKLPGNQNFFCGRGCSTSHRNTHRTNNGEHLIKHRFKPGDTARQVYDQKFTWYIHRLTTDQRRDLKYVGDRLELQNMLVDQWNAQEGKCAITNVPLHLRVGQRGTCPIGNMFYVASVDRIDNTVPYQQGNIQWVSTAINRARGNTDFETFKQHLAQLVQELN